MNTTLHVIKDTTAYAFALGFWERLTMGDAFGRTHDTCGDWNEAYDRGANFADSITGHKGDQP